MFWLFRESSSSESNSTNEESDLFPNSDTDSEADDIVEVDPCVSMLHRQISNGLLTQDHIFYKYVSNALSFAENISNPSAQFTWDRTVKGFATTLKCLGGSRTANCIRGPGFLHQKFGGTYTFNWSDWNFPFPPPVDDIGYTTASGIIKPFLEGALSICFNDRQLANALIDTPTVFLIPLVTSKDGMAIKPGFQFDRRTKQIIGGEKILTLEDVNQMRGMKPEEMKSQFHTEAETWCMSTLDSSLHFTVGVDYSVKSVKGSDVLENDTHRIQQIEQCQRCLKNSNDVTVATDCKVSPCVECTNNEVICMTCTEKGYNSWNPKFRPCDSCVINKVKCSRGVVLAHAMDCESKNLAAMKAMRSSTDSSIKMVQPIPDPPHRAKNFDQSSANWFLFIDGCRFNRSLLRTLRNRETSISPALKEVVSDRALRRRDRQDTSYVFDSTSEALCDILGRIEYCVHTIIPEPLRKSDSNKPGVLTHPIGIAVDNGILFITDFEKDQVFKARMHYPVDVEEFGSGFQSPRGVAFFGGVVFVCEKSQIFYKDIGGNVVVQPKKMRKQQLVDAMTARHLPTAGKGVRELQNDLNDWMLRHGPVQQERVPGRHVLFLDRPTISGTAITGVRTADNWSLFVSCPKEDAVHRLTVTTDGAKLSAKLTCLTKVKNVTGLAVRSTELFLAVNDEENGGIYIFNLETRVMKKIFVSCHVFDVAITQSGLIVFTEPSMCRVRGFTFENGDCGTAFAIGEKEDVLLSKDGCETTSKLVQPTGITTEGETVYICDTGIGAVKLVVPIAAYITFLRMINQLMRIFGLHYKFPPCLSDAIRMLREVVTYFRRAVMQAAEKQNRPPEGMQGPQGVPSYTAVSSIEDLLTSMENLSNIISTNFPNYKDKVHVKSLTTLMNEHLHSCMRERYPMPTHLEFAQTLSPVVEEAAKRVINTGFKYFTGRKSYYDVPESATSIQDFPRVPKPSSIPMAPQNIVKMRQFISDFGDPVRQMTVRGLSTQDKPGTLPISAYGDSPNEINVIEIRKLLAHNDQDQLLASRNEIIAIGRHNFCNLDINHSAISGPFLLCRAKSDFHLRNNVQLVELFVQDENDPLHFYLHDKCNININACRILPHVEVEGHRRHLYLDENVYTACIDAFEDETPEPEEAEEDADDGVQFFQVQTTQRGRAVNIPHRYR